MDRIEAIDFLINNPYKVGHMIGFNDLKELHNEWIKDMVNGKEDSTLQAHRGSYKTTCVSISLALIIVLYPKLKTAFFRKTDTDVRDTIRQTQNILMTPQMSYFIECIYGAPLKFTEKSGSSISTNLSIGIKGEAQLIGIGTSSSVTGKHYDRIFTDDIVNIKDRISKAERESTKTFYRELQNLKNRGGRIYNTGTPWHKNDCFSIMPEAKKYSCYDTGMIDDRELQNIKSKLTPSLFAANYELRHIAEEDVIFADPKKGADSSLVEQGTCHIDAAYHGEDYTAFTIGRKVDDTFYIFGKMWRKHVDDVEDEIIEYRKAFNAGKIYSEDNSDKGYLKKSLKRKGERAASYHESMNKHLKIITYLKDVWGKVVFVTGTDESYIEQICDYNENAEHDDAPDSLASIIRLINKKPRNEYLLTI